MKVRGETGKDMNRIETELKLSQRQIEEVGRKFHFDEKDAGVLTEMAGRMEEAVQGVFTFVWDEDLKEKIESDQRYVLCCATLGGGLDELLESLEAEHLLLEAYMLECLSMEMLSLLYEAGRREIEKSGWFVTRYDFLEGKEEELERLSGEAGFPVEYREGYLIPQKSVIYAAVLSQEKSLNGQCGICSNCSKKDCPQRKEKVRSPKELLYGYRRILGG